MVQAKAWLLAKHFDGFPTESNFGLKLEQLPEPKDGGEEAFFECSILIYVS
jgi:prostaglandin reductase 1